MLIDELQARSDAVEFMTVGTNVRFSLIEGDTTVLYVDDMCFPMVDGAVDSLLNLLRIPIKYFERMVDAGEPELAVQNVNYWLSIWGHLSLLIEDEEVTQVFDGKRLYVPSYKINDIIVDNLIDCEVVDYSVNDDLFQGVYVSQKQEDIGNGKLMSVGIRALYSDCFTVTPRFDALLYDRETKTMYCYPVEGRKFRAASTTVSQVLDQVVEFIILAKANLHQKLMPALVEKSESSEKVKLELLVSRLCSDLRLNRKQECDIIGAVKGQELNAVDATIAISAHVQQSDQLSLSERRDIQIALSRYIISGNFK